MSTIVIDIVIDIVTVIVVVLVLWEGRHYLDVIFEGGSMEGHVKPRLIILQSKQNVVSYGGVHDPRSLITVRDLPTHPHLPLLQLHFPQQTTE